jgi:hypothetical protein
MTSGPGDSGPRSGRSTGRLAPPRHGGASGRYFAWGAGAAPLVFGRALERKRAAAGAVSVHAGYCMNATLSPRRAVNPL